MTKFINVVAVHTALCLVVVSAASLAAENAELQVIAEGLDYPSNVIAAPDSTQRLFVTEAYSGKVRVVSDGEVLPEAFLDIGGRMESDSAEEGLLSLAFPPDFPNAPSVYVSYTGGDNSLIVSRFKVDERTGEAIPSSEERILTIPRWSDLHICGHIEFGPADGFLYVCTGDSDQQGSPHEASQDLSLLNGKILRIDVSPDQDGYSIPVDNPFVNEAGVRPEIWAYGLRNPWKFSFDSGGAGLIIPDVGRDHWEEINYLPPNAGSAINFGWPLAEGNDCVAEESGEICAADELRWPVFEYHHRLPEMSCAVVGGATYDGRLFPDWSGVYVFADYCNGSIWALRNIQDGPEIRQLSADSVNPTAIGVDHDGEIVVADGPAGRLYRLLFPEDFTAGWKTVEEVMFDSATRARRTGSVAGLALRDSSLWRLLEWVRQAYNAAGRPLD